jgi:hypothetical protein
MLGHVACRDRKVVSSLEREKRDGCEGGGRSDDAQTVFVPKCVDQPANASQEAAHYGEAE